MHTVNLDDEVLPQLVLARVHRFLAGEAAAVQFVIRSEVKVDAPLVFLEEVFPRGLVVDCEASEWPGTKLLHGVARVLKFDLDDGQSRSAVGVVHPWEWIHPTMPEDPAFFRSDGTLLSGCCSHEKFMTLTLREPEWVRILGEIPELAHVAGE